MLIRLLCCGAMGAARLLELAYSRRNLRDAGDTREGRASRSTFPLIVLVHAAVIGGTAVWGRKPRFSWLALLLAVQPVRLWVLLTLRDRWNARGAVACDMTVATDGPYAYVRHPNYTVVMVELLSLPMAFGLRRLALSASLANVPLLALRIRDEEALLTDLPGYLDHFADKPRFMPRIGFKRRGEDSPHPAVSALQDQ
jgi:methyltransferase